MPSNQEFYDAISNISIDADTLNLNTDQVESKLDTANGLLTTLSADTAIIKADMTDGVLVSTYPLQGTTVTNSNFTSTTASSSLVSAVAGRDVFTVFNEGAGILYISAGGTCTTTSYQVRLSSGDYWECPAGQLSLAHTAVFATAGTARVTQIS